MLIQLIVRGRTPIEQEYYKHAYLALKARDPGFVALVQREEDEEKTPAITKGLVTLVSVAIRLGASN